MKNLQEKTIYLIKTEDRAEAWMRVGKKKMAKAIALGNPFAYHTDEYYLKLLLRVAQNTLKLEYGTKRDYPVVNRMK